MFKIEGFGFQRADEMAKELGIGEEHPTRIEAGVLHILELESMNGHVFMDQNELMKKANRLLYQRQQRLTEEHFTERIKHLEEEDLLVSENNRAYLPHLYYSEEGIASQLKRIMDIEVEESFEESELLKIIGEMEEVEGLSYGEEQYEAIKKP
ncbi:helix-hairpin-helix domain-containing protein [Piscibacillus salipiscarius]|uniref:helix-hairpin-helix domain-containing protein n=1 Tax=Piscibacillus salipiscarius TaxID=299480 RepID=UPI00272B0BE2|nr:helix-hairpin-helix domain-containing protein [Piscibacillus salipiscarius]